MLAENRVANIPKKDDFFQQSWNLFSNSFIKMESKAVCLSLFTGLCSANVLICIHFPYFELCPCHIVISAQTAFIGEGHGADCFEYDYSVCVGQPGTMPSQQGFMKGRSCLTNLIFYDPPSGWGRCWGYDLPGKAFDSVSHSILLEKLATHGLDRSTLCWVKSWQDGQVQRVVVNGVKSSWWLITSGVGQYWGQPCLVSLLMSWRRG